jgi:hypothetical protein
MTYQEALARTVKLTGYAKEYNHTDVEYSVVPSNYKEMEAFLNDYYELAEKQTEFNCKKYCSDENFSVYRIDESSDNGKTEPKHSLFKR